jgi:hypothetical protein
MKPFPYPIDTAVLLHFTHPCPTSPYHHTVQIGDHYLATNNEITIAAHITKTRGLNPIQPFQPQPNNPAQSTRYQAIATFAENLHQNPTNPAHLIPIDDLLPRIRKRPTIPLFYPNHQPFPSPHLTINQQPILLSHIQLILRLPNIRIDTSHGPREQLTFHYNGGIVVVHPQPHLHESRPILRHLEPRIDPETQTRLPSNTPPRINLGLKNWPPAIDPDTEILRD